MNILYHLEFNLIIKYKIKQFNFDTHLYKYLIKECDTKVRQFIKEYYIRNDESNVEYFSDYELLKNKELLSRLV